MKRLTKLSNNKFCERHNISNDSFWYTKYCYYVDAQESIYSGKAINKLAEYENLGDLVFIKELVNAYNNEWLTRLEELLEENKRLKFALARLRGEKGE